MRPLLFSNTQTSVSYMVPEFGINSYIRIHIRAVSGLSSVFIVSS